MEEKNRGAEWPEEELLGSTIKTLVMTASLAMSRFLRRLVRTAQACRASKSGNCQGPVVEMEQNLQKGLFRGGLGILGPIGSRSEVFLEMGTDFTSIINAAT